MDLTQKNQHDRKLRFVIIDSKNYILEGDCFETSSILLDSRCNSRVVELFSLFISRVVHNVRSVFTIVRPPECE